MFAFEYVYDRIIDKQMKKNSDAATFVNPKTMTFFSLLLSARESCCCLNPFFKLIKQLFAVDRESRRLIGIKSVQLIFCRVSSQTDCTIVYNASMFTDMVYSNGIGLQATPDWCCQTNIRRKLSMTTEEKKKINRINASRIRYRKMNHFQEINKNNSENGNNDVKNI